MEAIRKILDTPAAFVLFLVAIVSLIGVIAKGETDKAIARIPIDATLTAEARLPTITKFSNITQSANLPLATWTLLPIDTQTPTSAPTTVNIVSSVLLQDDFIDNRNGWLLLNEQFIKSNIIGGKYKHIITCPLEYDAFYCGNYFLVPSLSSKNLQFELAATIKDISTSDGEVMIAFQLRRNDSSYYSVYFRSLGQYTVNIIQNGSLAKLLEHTTIPDFSPNTDTVNHYGFSAIDTLITPLFNSQGLLSVEDGNINQAGSVYIAIFVSRGSSAIVELDNLVVTDKSKE